jgi:hypothetical protein
VLELRSARPSVVLCSAHPAAIDRVVGSAAADVLRVAPDEALAVSSVDGGALATSIETQALAVDPDALVLDATDGWAVWSLTGDRTSDALARLSDLDDPGAGFAQGRVADVPAKVVIEPSRLTILVPSMWSEAVRERILAVCADLGVREPAAGTGAATG